VIQTGCVNIVCAMDEASDLCGEISVSRSICIFHSQGPRDAPSHDVENDLADQGVQAFVDGPLHVGVLQCPKEPLWSNKCKTIEK